jgi:hypothetical protein
VVVSSGVADDMPVLFAILVYVLSSLTLVDENGLSMVMYLLAAAFWAYTYSLHIYYYIESTYMHKNHVFTLMGFNASSWLSVSC